MAITGAIEIADLIPDETTKALKKLKSIIAKDNVKDLAKTQKNKFDVYATKQNKTNLETPDNKNPDKDFLDDNALDKRIEEEFDKYLLFIGNDAIGTIDKIKTGNLTALQVDFNAYLQKEFGNNSEFSLHMNLLKNAEIKDALQPFSFELETLSQEVMNILNTEDKDDIKPGDPGNVIHNDKDEPGNVIHNDRDPSTTPGNKEAKKYHSQNDYIDPYENTRYTTPGKEQDIANIYRDNKLAKYMEKVFDDEDGKELRRGTFRVNLGIEDGLAGIIIAIRDAIANKDNTDITNTDKQRYKILSDSGVLTQNGTTIDLEFSKKDLKKMIKDGFLKYEHQGGLDDEVNKIAKILSRAKRRDLDAFASLLQSKSDIVMAVKEWNNTKEMTGNDVEHPGETSLITANNVLNFLCDFNSDGRITAAPKRKDNKEQRNQGDIGTLFGQQVFFTIDQAIAVKKVELGEAQSEQFVISNIIKNMVIADSRGLTNTHLITMRNDPSECTKTNLAKLINGSTGDDKESVYPMPEMKIFFLDAIKKINGGSEVVQPDLYDTLVGKDAEAILSLNENETELRTKLDEILSQSKDPETIAIIRKEGLVRVRETLFIKIMTAIDNVEITTNDGAKSQLQAAGVSKGREIAALKKQLLENTIKSLILSGIHYSTTGGLRLTIGYGKEGKSESGRTKRARGAGGGLVIGTETIELAINLSGEVAEQYNHQRVINADLSQVRSAKYLGIEGGAYAGVGLKNSTGISVEASAGINRQQDPEVGINQLDKQYRAVSEEIFDITDASTVQLADKEQFRQYIVDRIDGCGSHDPYKEFIRTNYNHLTKNNLDFIVRYMDANNFFGTDGVLNKFPKANVTNSINALLDIIQSGNIEQRRHDVIAGLHGKVALTKLSFGVTTNALTLKSSSGTMGGAPTPLSYSGETNTQGNTTGGAGTNESGGGSQGGLGNDRFGICGLYIGLRISTWKNSYVPNVAHYLFTQYETGQGIGMEYINNPAKDLDKYGQYLIALYNDPQKRLSYEIDPTDTHRLILRFDPKGSDLTLAKFLNIHGMTKAQPGFSLRGNVLTLGNVGEIAAYTITEAKGVRRMLCLGSKKMDDANRITGNIGPVTVEPMKLTETGNKARTKEKINTDIVANMTGDGKNVDTVKTETATFFDAEGKLQTPADYTVTFTPTTIEGTSLQENGTLTITKLSDKIFSVDFNTTTSPDKLTINYIDQEEYDIARKAAEAIASNRDITEIASSTEIQAMFSLPTHVSNVFTQQTEHALSIFDDHHQTLYKEFMESIVDTGLDLFIDASDYTKAFDILKRILAKNPKYDELNDLKTLIEKPDLSPEESMLIVDKFKTIFSYNIYLSDGKNDGKNLSELIATTRKNTYTKMAGPNGDIYPLTTDYRKTILASFKGEDELTRTPVENLIGFTAFYRLNGTGRKYAMTPVGGTNVLTGSTLAESMISLNGTDKKSAQEWFIKNLDVNSDNKKMVIDKINLLLKTNNVTIKEQDLPKLLTGEYLAIDSFEKISIDINRVFYLLGECGNESFGMEIKGIKIQKFKDVPVPGKYTASGTPEKEYKGGMDLNLKSHSITSKVLTKEEKASIKHHHSKGVNVPIGKSKAGDTNNKGKIESGDGNNE